MVWALQINCTKIGQYQWPNPQCGFCENRCWQAYSKSPKRIVAEAIHCLSKPYKSDSNRLKTLASNYGCLWHRSPLLELHGRHFVYAPFAILLPKSTLKSFPKQNIASTEHGAIWSHMTSRTRKTEASLLLALCIILSTFCMKMSTFWFYKVPNNYSCAGIGCRIWDFSNAHH